MNERERERVEGLFILKNNWFIFDNSTTIPCENSKPKIYLLLLTKKRKKKLIQFQVRRAPLFERSSPHQRQIRPDVPITLSSCQKQVIQGLGYQIEHSKRSIRARCTPTPRDIASKQEEHCTIWCVGCRAWHAIFRMSC